MPDHTRRTFLTAAGLAGLVGSRSTAAAQPRGAADPWTRATALEARVRAPHFPRRYVDITEFGAVPDEDHDSTEAIRRAVINCHRSGGGHVVVPPGVFRTGPIRLLSDVDLHVSAGATLRFSTDPADYLPAVLTRFEGVELHNYSPLIYAHDQDNIAITGGGVLDGQADHDHWWPWKGKPDFGWQPGDPFQEAARERLFALAERGVPVSERAFGDGDCLRPSFIEPYRCRRVLIEGVTIIGAPMWQVHPTLCEDVVIQGITADSHGPNNDGCNPESCRRVIIRDCTFDTGDDCIAIKSGRNADGRRIGVPSQDIMISGCRMRDGHGGVTIGSEMSGGVRNVFVRDCELSSPNLDKALRFKTNSVRGGFIEGFYAKDLTIGTVGGNVIDIDFFYEEGAGHGHDPVVHDLDIRTSVITSANRALHLRGYPEAPITGVVLTDLDFRSTRAPSLAQDVEELVLTEVYENGAPLRL